MLTFPRRTWDSLKMLQSVEAKLTGLGTMWGALPPFSQHLGQPHREPFLPAPAPELCTGQHTQKLVCFAKRVKGASGLGVPAHPWTQEWPGTGLTKSSIKSSQSRSHQSLLVQAAHLGLVPGPGLSAAQVKGQKASPCGHPRKGLATHPDFGCGGQWCVSR